MKNSNFIAKIVSLLEEQGISTGDIVAFQQKRKKLSTKKLPLEVLYSDNTRSFYVKSDKTPIAVIIGNWGIALEDAQKKKGLRVAEKYCNNYFLGDRKWKLPTKKELKLLYENKKIINEVLKALGKKSMREDDCYWSSSLELNSLNSSAWVLYFRDGAMSFYTTTSSCYVRPVTNLNKKPLQILTNAKLPLQLLYSDGAKSFFVEMDKKPIAIICDTVAISIKNFFIDDYSNEVQWNEAQSYCKKLSTGGIEWRLPTKKELNLIYQYKNEINKILLVLRIPNMNVGWYWSSTENGYNRVWLLHFSDGYEDCDNKCNNYYYVLPVLDI